jgi:hypothetical protein
MGLDKDEITQLETIFTKLGMEYQVALQFLKKSVIDMVPEMRDLPEFRAEANITIIVRLLRRMTLELRKVFNEKGKLEEQIKELVRNNAKKEVDKTGSIRDILANQFKGRKVI